MGKKKKCSIGDKLRQRQKMFQGCFKVNTASTCLSSGCSGQSLLKWASPFQVTILTAMLLNKNKLQAHFTSQLTEGRGEFVSLLVKFQAVQSLCCWVRR